MSSGTPPPTQGEQGSVRDERIATILSECSDRLNAGETIDAATILASSAELLPELGWALESLSNSAPTSSAAPRLETVGRHRILHEIGRGGMGIVYDAVELTLGRRVALKVLPLPAFVQGDRRERFLREARAAARLHHTHIVPVFEVGEEKGVLYYTMQHIVGRSLDVRLQQLKAAEPPAAANPAAASNGYFIEVAKIGAEVASALAYAHREGVVHRDVKPSNVIVDEQGCSWLTDFGLAKSDLESDALTQSGDVLGTVAYMAPERLSGEGDGRSDVYSLGATLYEMLALKPPFQSSDRRQLMRAVAEEEVKPLRRTRPQIPRDLETIVLTAMAREPVHRYGSAEALQTDLERFLRGDPIAARRSSAPEQIYRWCRRHPLVASLCAAVALLLITLVAVLAVSSRSLRQRLYEAELARAQALLVSGQPGRRFESLAAVSRAVQLAADDAARIALRDVAVHALTLVDVREVLRRPEPLAAAAGLVCGRDLRRYAVLDRSRDEIVLRTVDDGAELQRLGGADGVTWLNAISADERFLAAGRVKDGRHSVRLWRLEDASVWLDCGDGSTNRPFAFQPDAKCSAVAKQDETIEVIDLDSKRVVAVLRPSATPGGLKFSPASDRLAVAHAQNGVVEIFELDPNRSPTVIECADWVADFAWDSHGDMLAVASTTNQHVRTWNTRNGDLLQSLEGHLGGITRVLFTPDGSLLSASWDGTTRLWEPWSGDLLATTQSGGAVSDISRDGRRLSLIAAELIVMELEPGTEKRVYKSLLAPLTAGGQSLQFHPAGRLLLTSWGLWDTARGERIDLGAANPRNATVVFTPDGKALLSPRSGGVWERSLELLCTESESVLRLGEAGRRLDLAADTGPITFDPTGRWLLALESSAKVVLLDRTREHSKSTLGEHVGADTVSVSSDGKWGASGTYLRGLGVRIWDLAGARLDATLEAKHPAGAYFSPCNRWLATASATTFSVYAVSTWTLTHRIEREATGGVRGPLAWRPGTHQFAVAITPNEVQFFDAQSGEAAERFRSDQLRAIQAIAFSPDGDLLALGRANATVEVWDLRRIKDGLANLGLSMNELSVAEQGPARAPSSTAAARLRLEWVRASPNEAESGPGEDDIDAIPTATFQDAVKLGQIAARLEEERNFEALIRLWEKALAGSPNSSTAMNNLAWVLVIGPEELRDPERALTLAKAATATEDGKRNSAFVNTLGVAQYRAGEHRQAVDTLLASGRLAGSVTAWDGLFIAMALQRLGLDAVAADYYLNAKRWMARQPDLPKDQLRQLRALEAEAARMLEATLPRAAGGSTADGNSGK